MTDGYGRHEQDPPTDEGPRLHPLLQLIADRPISRLEDDRLGFIAYADALAEVIDSPTAATPLNLCIDAPWGAGKTSLAKLVEDRLREWPKERGSPPYIICWFNAWLHGDAPSIGAALAANVAKAVNQNRPLWRRLLNPLPTAMLTPQERWRRRLGLGAIAFVVAGLAFVLLGTSKTVVKVTNQGKVAVGLSILAGIPVLTTLWSRAFSIAQAAASFVDDPKSQAATGAMADVAEQLGSLVRSGTRGKCRLVIFVDDIERCESQRAVEICETANLLLAHPDVITVLIGDLSGLRDFIRTKLQPDPAAAGKPGSPTRDYGRDYFDKIVQVDFSLPSLDRTAPGAILIDSPSSPPPPPPVTAEMTDPSWVARARSALAKASILIAGTPKALLSFVVVGTIVLSLLSIPLHWLDPSDNTTGALVFVFGIVCIGLILYALVLWVRRRRKRRMARTATDHVDSTIRSSVQETSGTGISTVSDAISQSSASLERDTVTSKASPKLVEQVARKIVIEELVADATKELIPFLPRLPRSVKRMVNQERLLISVAVCRDMIGPEVTARHVGKWAVLLERWPDLADAVIAQPEMMQIAEGAAGQRDLDGVSAPVPTLPAARQELIDFLNGATKLGPVIERLISALPATSSAGIGSR
jgi:hypothetical protein